MKVPTKNIHSKIGATHNLPGAERSHYPASVVTTPHAVKSAVSARHAAHKAHGRHSRGV